MAAINYEKYLIKEPARGDRPDVSVRNVTFPSLTYMSSALVPEVKYHIEFGWVWGMPEPNPYVDERTYDYDKILLNIGGDCRNPEDLGADIEYVLGGQTLNINSTGAVLIPRGVKHGPLTYKGFRYPHVRITILLRAGERLEERRGNSADVAESTQSDQGIDFERYLVRKPAYEVIAGTPVKNRQGPSSMTFMSKNLVPESNIYVEGGWVWGMPDPNPHIFEHVHHDYEELVLHFGTDYRHPEELGGEIEFWLGGQSLIIDRTAMVFVPKSVKHGPLVWKKYSAPHLEMAIIPGAGTLNEADPGGHREKMANERKKG
jgi:hypothetical protein